MPGSGSSEMGLRVIRYHPANIEKMVRSARRPDEDDGLAASPPLGLGVRQDFHPGDHDDVLAADEGCVRAIGGQQPPAAATLGPAVSGLAVPLGRGGLSGARRRGGLGVPAPGGSGARRPRPG